VGCRVRDCDNIVNAILFRNGKEMGEFKTPVDAWLKIKFCREMNDNVQKWNFTNEPMAFRALASIVWSLRQTTVAVLVGQ
jgi:hypothetical protein